MNCINLSADDIASLDKKDIISKQHYQNNENRIFLLTKRVHSCKNPLLSKMLKHTSTYTQDQI